MNRIIVRIGRRKSVYITLLVFNFILLILFGFLILAQFGRDPILEWNMPEYRDPFSDNELNIYIVTWNVEKTEPSIWIDRLFETLRPNASSPDVYAIGLQELPWSTLFVNRYTKVFDDYFLPKNYIRLKEIKSGTIGLYVYVRREQILEYYYVATDYLSLNLFGTKAAVAVRFFIKNLSICLVSAHLEPHEPNFKQRLEQFSQSIRTFRFSNSSYDTLLHQDMIFYFGDLNFRIDHLTSEEVMEMIDAKQYDLLLEYDQLYKILVDKTTNLREGFNEANITFAPTYKYVVGTNLYNFEKRKPAYTDRVIYRNILAETAPNFLMKKAAQFTVSEYKPIPTLMNSDHKPVTATVSIPITANTIAPNIRLATIPLHSRNTRETHETHNICCSPGSPDGQQASSNQHQTSSLPFDSPSADPARNLRVNFEEISPLTRRRNFSVYFNVIDRRNGHALPANNPDLAKALSTWDWIGLYKIDFMSPDDYLTFAYAKFNNTDLVDNVEVAEDALLWANQISPIQHSSASSPAHNLTADNAVDLASSSSSQQQTVYDSESTQQEPRSSEDSSLDESSSVSSLRPESGDHSLSSSIGRMDDSVDRPKIDQKSLTKDNEISLSSHSKSPKIDPNLVPLSSEVSDDDNDDTLSISSYLSSREEKQSKDSENIETTTAETEVISPSSSSSPQPPSSSHGDDTRFSVQFDNQDFSFFPGRYILLYVRQNGDVLGVSEPFEKLADDSDEELYRRDDQNQF